MSGNNQLVIIEIKKLFEIHHNLCVDNVFEPSKRTLLAAKKSLREAIKFTEEYCNEYPYVEYGYTIRLQEKK